MSKTNDRWSALSMRDRAELINIYVKSGITDLGEIRKDYNSFDDGGELNIPVVTEPILEEPIEDNVNSLSTYDVEKAVNDYNKEWYNARKNIGLNAYYNKGVDSYNNSFNKEGWSPSRGNYEVPFVPLVKAPKGNINETGEYVEAPGGNGILTKNIFYNAPILEKAKEDLGNFLIDVPAAKVRYNSDKSGAAGYYKPIDGNVIHINSKDVPNDARINIGVHESAHRLTNKGGRFDASYFGDLPVDSEPYWGSPTEQYGRLHQLRDYLKLDPNKVYSENEVQDIINNTKFGYDYHKGTLGDQLLYKYSTPELTRMINNSFSKGGKLNKFAEGGPTEPIYYDDTYIEPARVKAFDSQEDYNRYLGEKGAKIVREGTNEVAQNIFKGLEYAPIIGDGIDLANAVEATQQGNFKKAGVIAGAALLPNIVEKPVKAISKGIRNLNTYRKYVKDTERFRNSVNFALKGYEKNYDVLQSNVPNKLNSIEEAKHTSSFTPISTKLKLFKKDVAGDYNLQNDEIWLNAYNRSYLKDAIKSPKKAIRRLQGVATHEGNHMALNHLNDVTAIKGKDYFDPIANHPMNKTTSHLFNNPNREVKNWQRVPEEFVSEMNYVRNATGNAPGSSIYSWKDSHTKRAEKYLSNRFKFTPEETREAINTLEGLGYSNGGKLNIENPFDSNYIFEALPEDSIIIPYRDIVTPEMNSELIKQSGNKFDTFVEKMYPIVEQSLVKKGYSQNNINNILKQMAQESNYGLSPRGNGYNLSGIKAWNDNEGTKHSDGEFYRDFKDYSDYVDYYVDLLNNRYDALNAKDTDDYIYRLHHTKDGRKYSADEEGYKKNLKNMVSLDRAINKYLNK